MEAVIGVFVILLLIWISIKVVKFIIKVVLWVLVFGIIVALLGYYYPFPNSLHKKKNQPQSSQSSQRPPKEK